MWNQVGRNRRKVEERFRMKYELTKYPNRKYPKEVPCKIIWKKTGKSERKHRRKDCAEKIVETKGAVIENPGVPKKQSHLIRNVVIAVAALCVVGYAVSRSQNKNKLSQEKN